MPTENNQTKFHISLNVQNLEAAVGFYARALGMMPTKHFPDYAKFEMDEPPVVLSLEPGRADGQSALNHIGIRVGKPEMLQELRAKVHAVGLEPQFLQGVECCYSRQTKICLNDPDNTLFEYYFLEADHVAKNEAAPRKTEAPPQTAGAPTAWDHLLGQPFPLPHPSTSEGFDEVRLRGTLNLKRSGAEEAELLEETFRILKPGGSVMMHLLVSDIEVTKALPKLPGPAALVEHTPVENKVIEALENAGFVGIEIKRLSHSAVFQFDGAQMRELMVTAKKTNALDDRSQEATVVYKGPMAEVKDDSGQTYLRGQRTKVTPLSASLLRHSSMADSFVFLNATGPACAAPAEAPVSEASF